MASDPNLHEKAVRFRKEVGPPGMEETLQRVVDALYKKGVAHLMIGGYAMQEHGVLRYTDDLDIVVSDLALAARALAEIGFAPTEAPPERPVLDPSNPDPRILIAQGRYDRVQAGPFKRRITLTDPETGIDVDLFQGGT